MNILSVESTEYQGGIPLPDFESVKGALQAFSEGRTAGSHAGKQEFVANGGGMIAMMLELVQSGSSRFVDRLCDKIEADLSFRSNSHNSFDYEGPGPFFKCTVNVIRLEDDSFLLSLSAAYVGNTIEQGLADYLGVQRGLWRTSVSLKLDAAQGDMFAIDFDPIMDKLGGTVLWTRNGHGVAKIIANGYMDSYSTVAYDAGVATLMGGDLRDTVDPSITDSQLTVTIGVDTSSVGEYYKNPFTVNGSVLNGQLREDYDDPKVYIAPRVIITIMGNPNESNRLDTPVIDPAIQHRMRALASEVVAHFSS